MFDGILQLSIGLKRGDAALETRFWQQRTRQCAIHVRPNSTCKEFQQLLSEHSIESSIWFPVNFTVQYLETYSKCLGCSRMPKICQQANAFVNQSLLMPLPHNYFRTASKWDCCTRREKLWYCCMCSTTAAPFTTVVMHSLRCCKHAFGHTQKRSTKGSLNWQVTETELLYPPPFPHNYFLNFFPHWHCYHTVLFPSKTRAFWAVFKHSEW